jgi:hypothetical protein
MSSAVTNRPRYFHSAIVIMAIRCSHQPLLCYPLRLEGRKAFLPFGCPRIPARHGDVHRQRCCFTVSAAERSRPRRISSAALTAPQAFRKVYAKRAARCFAVSDLLAFSRAPRGRAASGSRFSLGTAILSPCRFRETSWCSSPDAVRSTRGGRRTH